MKSFIFLACIFFSTSAYGDDYVKVRIFEPAHPDTLLSSSTIIGNSFSEKLMTKDGFNSFVAHCRQATKSPEVPYPEDCKKKYVITTDETYTKVSKQITPAVIQEDGKYVAPKRLYVLVPVDKNGTKIESLVK